MNDFTVLNSAELAIMQERFAHLIEKIHIMNNAIDNCMPGEALLEIRRAKRTIEAWNGLPE
jgi:hypothetical protein